jgi:hypothetical protein
MEGKIEGTRSRGIRRKQLLNDFMDKGRYWNFKEKALSLSGGLVTEGEAMNLAEGLATEGEAMNLAEGLAAEGEAMNRAEGLATEGEAMNRAEGLATEGEAMNRAEGLSTEGEAMNRAEDRIRNNCFYQKLQPISVLFAPAENNAQGELVDT